MRYLCEVAYFGEKYCGWQRQINAVSVQQVLEECFSTVLRKKIEIVGSGRTDAGVHATQQYFHFDYGGLSVDILHKLNSILPSDIALNSIRRITEDSHARFSAVQRGYIYQIVTQKNPFQFGRSYFLKKSIDLAKMNEAASFCIGERDFKSFSKVKTDVKHYLCTVHMATWLENGPSIIFRVEANRFLRGMVRAMVGTMLLVGEGAIDLDEFKQILNARNRKTAGQNVPACGLYLNKVEYPKEIFI